MKLYIIYDIYDTCNKIMFITCSCDLLVLKKKKLKEAEFNVT